MVDLVAPRGSASSPGADLILMPMLFPVTGGTVFQKRDAQPAAEDRLSTRTSRKGAASHPVGGPEMAPQPCTPPRAADSLHIPLSASAVADLETVPAGVFEEDRVVAGLVIHLPLDVPRACGTGGFR